MKSYRSYRNDESARWAVLIRPMTQRQGQQTIALLGALRFAARS